MVEGREQDSATNPENRTFSPDFVIFATFFFLLANFLAIGGH